jgi:hypothetical protein
MTLDRRNKQCPGGFGCPDLFDATAVAAPNPL